MGDNPITKLESLAKEHPMALYGGVGVGILAVVVVVVRSKRQAVATPTSTASPSTSAATPSTSGDSLSGYDIASMAGIPYGTETSVPYTVAQTPVQATATATSTPSAPTTESGSIRGSLAGVNGNVSQSYDKSHTGVPLHSAPNTANATLLTTVPFNSQIQITGNSVPGTAAVPGYSSQWYPVTVNGRSGYINAYDIGNIVVNAATGVGTGMSRAWTTFRHDNPDDLYGHENFELDQLQVN